MENKKNIYLSLILIFVCISRIIPHPYNFSPVGSIFLIAPLFFSNKKWSLAISFIPLIISDFLIGKIIYKSDSFLYSGFSYWSVVTNLELIPVTTTTTLVPPTTTTTTTNPCVTPTPTSTTTTTTAAPVNCYTGTLIGRVYIFSGTAYTDYDDLVIATLRSRGLATYGTDDGAVYEVSGLTDVEMVCGNEYSAVTKNPYSTFALNVTDKDNNKFFFETSFSNSDSKYITKVFGTSNFAKPKETP